ncbi:hypothetical protein RJ55_02209 [Drechmeria coniospora]|nr:hypothetical protein RJ55_02209 [Drechmeria coniospora]
MHPSTLLLALVLGPHGAHSTSTAPDIFVEPHAGEIVQSRQDPTGLSGFGRSAEQLGAAAVDEPLPAAAAKQLRRRQDVTFAGNVEPEMVQDWASQHCLRCRAAPSMLGCILNHHEACMDRHRFTNLTLRLELGNEYWAGTFE